MDGTGFMVVVASACAFVAGGMLVLILVHFMVVKPLHDDLVAEKKRSTHLDEMRKNNLDVALSEFKKSHKAREERDQLEYERDEAERKYLRAKLEASAVQLECDQLREQLREIAQATLDEGRISVALVVEDA